VGLCQWLPANSFQLEYIIAVVFSLLPSLHDHSASLFHTRYTITTSFPDYLVPLSTDNVSGFKFLSTNRPCLTHERSTCSFTRCIEAQSNDFSCANPTKLLNSRSESSAKSSNCAAKTTGLSSATMASQDKDIGTTVSIQSQAAHWVTVLARVSRGTRAFFSRFGFRVFLFGLLLQVRKDHKFIPGKAPANSENSGLSSVALQRTVYERKLVSL
jgi:hypothetical protein